MSETGVIAATEVSETRKRVAHDQLIMSCRGKSPHYFLSLFSLFFFKVLLLAACCVFFSSHREHLFAVQVSRYASDVAIFLYCSYASSSRTVQCVCKHVTLKTFLCKQTHTHTHTHTRAPQPAPQTPTGEATATDKVATCAPARGWLELEGAG